MKIRTLTVTLAACAAFGMAGAGVAEAAPAGSGTAAAASARADVAAPGPWQSVGTFPTKAACEKKAKSMKKAGKIKDHRCWLAEHGYALAVHYS